MDFFFVFLSQMMNFTPFTLSFQVDDGRRLLPELPPGKTRLANMSRVLRRLRESYGEPRWKIRVLLDGEFTGIELDPRPMLKYVRVVFRVEKSKLGLVLCVDGVMENWSDVFFRLRYFGCMRNFFWDDRPTDQSIDRSDTKLATKLRNVEGHCKELAPWVDKTSPERSSPPHKKSPRSKSPWPYPNPEEMLRRERSRNDPRPLNRSTPRPLNRSNEEFIFENEKSHNNPPMNVKEAVRQEKLRDSPPPLGPPVGTGGRVDGEDSFSTSDGAADSFVHVFLFALAMIFCIWFKFSH